MVGSASMLPARSFAKRKSLRDQIERIDYLDEDGKYEMRFRMIEELEEDVQAGKNFRWHAPSTQSRQDHHLDLYKDFVCKWYKGLEQEEMDTMAEDEMTILLFPADSQTLAHQCSLFVTYAFKQAIPRSRAAGSIQIRTLCQYRDSLLYWGKWYYEHRGADFPYRKVFNEMVKSMRYVQSVYGDPLVKTERPWLGLAELRQLLDFEAVNNRCIELSEQHQVLWCIGRVTALRPGSLCPSGRYARTKPLTWRSLVFIQGTQRGEFHCRLTLDHIDIKRSEDTVLAAEAPSVHPLVINLTSPEPHNLVFSPAHRLLVIALRRGLLKGISNLDELLSSEFYEIRVSEEHLDDVVFLAGIPKGTALDSKKPLKAHALTEYLQRRGYQIGYTVPLTWYGIRRRAATDMARRIGLSATRIFLGHTPDSQTLERYYLNATETLDNMGILTDQGIEIGGHSKQMASKWAPLALGKLEDQSLQRIRGQALSEMTRRLILADPDGPEEDTAIGLKKYRRRVRRFAQQQLVEKEMEWQRGRITKDAMKQRTAALQASTFADEVLHHALDAMEARPRSQWLNTGDEPIADATLEDPTDEDGSLFIGGTDQMAEHEPEPEEDLEHTLSTTLAKDVELDEHGAFTLTIDSEIDAEDPRSKKLQDLSYSFLTRSAMQLLLDNVLSKHETWSQRSKTCPICQDDDTVTAEQAGHEYGSADKLDAHLTGYFHHPVNKWRRRAEQHTKRGGRYFCPYCAEAGIEQAKGFKRMPNMMHHIVESSQLSTSKKHDELKATDGWYDDDFENALNLGPTPRSLEKYMAHGAKSLTEVGIDTTPHRQLVGTEPYEHSDNIVRGSHPSAPLTSRHLPFVQSGDLSVPSAADAIPAQLKELITTGYPETLPNPLPQYMRDEVVVTDYRRSQEDDTEMGD